MIRLHNVFVFALAVSLATSLSARADFKVSITDSVTTYNFSDGGTGLIVVSLSDSAYTLIGTITTSNYPGTPELAQMDISYSISTNPVGHGLPGTGGLATISASSNDFSEPSLNPLTLISTINGNGRGSGTLTAQSYANTSNILFGGGVTSGPQGPFTIGAAGGYGSTASTQFNQIGDYSLTQVLTFNLGASQNTSGDFEEDVFPAPAPPSLLLAAFGFPFLGAATWMKNRRWRMGVVSQA